MRGANRIQGGLVTGNLLTGIPPELPEELVQILGSSPGVRIERIVSRGHASPEGCWYDQDWDEFVLLVKGRAGLRFEGESEVKELVPGDYLLIPAHLRHRVAWTEPSEDTVWLVVHYPMAGERA